MKYIILIINYQVVAQYNSKIHNVQFHFLDKVFLQSYSYILYGHHMPRRYQR